MVVEKVTEHAAHVHVYKAPGGSNWDAIRGRNTYSDGAYKGPRTGSDAGLLVADYDGCACLAERGYCDGGSLAMGGKKHSIATDLFPEA